MKNRHWTALAVICLLVYSIPASSQTQGTYLSLGAHWDDNTAVAATVTVAAVNLVGADTVLATRPLNEGWASVTLPLTSNSVYNVTLTSPAGAQLVKFPITTALINTQNLHRGSIALVLRKADNSLKNANVKVSMNF